MKDIINKLHRPLVGALMAMVALPAVLGATASVAQAASFTSLTLQNGWTNAPYSTSNAAVTNVSGIVRFKGAISGGSSAQAFTLPVAFRPRTEVYVPVDLCNAANGRLMIDPSGVVTVQAENAFSDAQCFTSLDGASFARSPDSLVPLTLQNGWTNTPWFNTADAAVGVVSGIVHLKGAIGTSGSNAQAFTLPVGIRPATEVYVPVDLCNAANGRLKIDPSGVVTVQAEKAFSDAQCFTSLDGASFALSSASLTALPLYNGWTNAPYGTSNAAVTNVSGIVHLKGAISSGATARAIVLPVGFRPATEVYVQVDLCNAANGRLMIDPSGVVTVQAEKAFSDAQCFTSLDGASFAQ
jgi:hypothetical protein